MAKKSGLSLEEGIAYTEVCSGNLAWLVCVSYWMVGLMSRRWAFDIQAAFGATPTFIGRLIVKLAASKRFGFQSLAGDFVDALISDDLEAILGYDWDEEDYKMPKDCLWYKIEEWIELCCSDKKGGHPKLRERNFALLKKVLLQVRNYPNEYTLPVTVEGIKL